MQQCSRTKQTSKRTTKNRRLTTQKGSLGTLAYLRSLVMARNKEGWRLSVSFMHQVPLWSAADCSAKDIDIFFDTEVTNSHLCHKSHGKGEMAVSTSKELLWCHTRTEAATPPNPMCTPDSRATVTLYIPMLRNPALWPHCIFASNTRTTTAVT